MNTQPEYYKYSGDNLTLAAIQHAISLLMTCKRLSSDDEFIIDSSERLLVLGGLARAKKELLSRSSLEG